MKPVIIDTNVILHDAYCLKSFKKRKVYVPISVIEELDHFKKGHEPINYNAREFLRLLDGCPDIHSGASIYGADVEVTLDPEIHPAVKKILPEETVDNKIINLAYTLGGIVVTKDANMRIKARALQVEATDYEEDKVEPPPSQAPITVTTKQLNKLFEDESLPYDDLYENQYVIVKAGKGSALSVFREGFLHLIKGDHRVAGIRAKNAEQTFALHALLSDIPLVVLSGISGSGKTLLAMAAAIERKSEYKQIYVSRPIIPLSNRDMGFLPGDVNDKLDPYMQPIFDNLGVIKDGMNEKEKSNIDKLIKEEKIKISPLAYIRGRSLNRLYYVLDESQNTTPSEMKTFLTRMGQGVKVVITGDIQQIDLPYLDSRSNGLSYLVEKLRGEKILAHVNLEKGERSELSEIASKKL